MLSRIIISAGRRKHAFSSRSMKTMAAVAVAGTVSIPFAKRSNMVCTQCEPELIPLPSITPTALKVTSVMKENKGFLIALVEATAENSKKLATSIYNFMKYTERLMTYALFSIPLVGLVPASYTLGSAFPAVEEFTWDYMIWAVQQLGPCFIKLAQWASTRPDLFPPSLVERLVKLQDNVEVSYTSDVLFNTLKDAFGSDFHNRLEVDDKPLGTGSVAQVFRGVLKVANHGVDTVQNVAIKMIHPHVEQLVNTDMELLTAFANFIDLFPSLEILSLGETCRQFGECMRKQLDLRVEASNLIQFSKKFAEDKWASFPEPVSGLVAKNVLVETLMEGTPITSYMDLPATKGDANYVMKMKLADLGARLVLKMVFFDNLVHGDLHPGNLLVQVMPDGEPRLNVLDCGIVYSSRTEEEFRLLADICYAFIKHDGREAGRCMVAQNPENTVKHADEFCESIQDMVDDSMLQNYFEHLGDYVSRICELSRQHVVRLDPGYFKIAMALKVAEGVSLALNRELDMISKCLPVLAKAEALRKLGITKFPAPEEDPERLLNNYSPDNTAEEITAKALANHEADMSNKAKSASA